METRHHMHDAFILRPSGLTPKPLEYKAPFSGNPFFYLPAHTPTLPSPRFYPFYNQVPEDRVLLTHFCLFCKV